MKSDKARLMTAVSYLDNICETDISTVDGVKRNPAWARLVLKSYARNISTLTKKSNIWRDIVANEESFSMATLDAYVNALQRLFVLEDVEAWHPSIRSATVIRSGKKPDLLMVITGGEMAYTREDGVKVVPIGCLKD